MRLDRDFVHCVGGNHAGIAVATDEHDNAIAFIRNECKTYSWLLVQWDMVRGTTVLEDGYAGSAKSLVNDKLKGPEAVIAAIRLVSEHDNKGRDGEDIKVILLLPLLHEVCKSHAVQTQLLNHLEEFRGAGKYIVGLLPPGEKLPKSVAPQFTFVSHELPDRETLAKLVRAYEKAGNCEVNAPDAVSRIAEAGLGLTHLQFDNEIATQLSRATFAGAPNVLSAEAMWTRRSEILNAEGLVKVLEPKAGFEKLGGMEGLKKFLLGCLQSSSSHPDAKPNGVLLVSMAGLGKSAICEALAHETDNRIVLMDFGSMRGGIVGETEKNMRRAFSVVDAMAPPADGKGYLIVLWDEIEKMLSNGGDAGTDSGVGVRQLGFVLTWLSTRKSRTFVVATANDATNMHAALTRAERFDALVYVEKPDSDARQGIWDIWLKHFDLLDQSPFTIRRTGTPLRWNPEGLSWVSRQSAAAETWQSTSECKSLPPGGEFFPALPKDEDWTGAEIRACCRLAKLRSSSLLESAESIVPVFHRYKADMLALEDWAKSACLSSETGRRFGLAESAATPAAKPSRRGRPKTDEGN